MQLFLLYFQYFDIESSGFSLHDPFLYFSFSVENFFVVVFLWMRWFLDAMGILNALKVSTETNFIPCVHTQFFFLSYNSYLSTKYCMDEYYRTSWRVEFFYVVPLWRTIPLDHSNYITGKYEQTDWSGNGFKLKNCSIWYFWSNLKISRCRNKVECENSKVQL